MIQVKNLSFWYHEGSKILKDINLHFDQRSTAIIGQNGAGKTTFAKLLKGLLKPCTGDIYIQNRNTKDTTAAALSKQIGLVFQNPNDQIFKGTVIDEVMVGPLNVKLDKTTAKQNSLKALEMVGLADQLEENPQDLSLSDKKLLCIASVIAMEPDIILFDEPTIAQDEAGKAKIKRIIQSLKEQNKLVMTIIHDMDFVAENFERTIVFYQGEVVLDGHTREVFSHTDILAKAQVETPYITQLGRRLGYTETFLTTDEFIKYKRNQNTSPISGFRQPKPFPYTDR
ncbi:energy-coupling factor ABC transporter ATP-binding protein [Paenactinomyces guangxiensis]|uniref:ABC transporter ATP-binding protein n=1 Tax=Paenactinomyces guangxiensis TaxID=1490290 RepID=A0A7W1WQD2_9BACL|nr:ABC transporter ATP-binding protein [Paenactinomyces guangxiensis]MBA4494142.1 ABC transporter ATP-binding protein [Paenactinomyces guangxiensis]MBH8591113.1 ABC transporter ATP-binding protein [Paenactinomyces guangxiensis]